MIFNSTTFFVFFILFFFLYWGINNRLNIKVRNAFTIIASYVFYGWWDWRFLSLIVISSAVDFIIGILLHKAEKINRRRLILLISVAANLGILGFFKYFNFFIDSLNELISLFSLNINTTTLKIILPVGISFYTFQTLSYSIDVYKRKIEPTKDIIAFFAFVSFFPQLVAGPIERASHLLPQFFDRKKFSYEDNIIGLRHVLWGFFKKIVIADNFGVLADSIFGSSGPLSGISIIAGSFFFALQIYADFSGYSEIAIGVARMLGYDIMVNFRTPYFARSFGDFWHRWHISLSTWFRDYLYIPLGGNKRSNLRVHFNILLTFTLSGLWHGANITFVIWGFLHGLLLVIEKQFRLERLKWAYYPVVLLIVVLLWIPFRAAGYTQFTGMINALVSFHAYSFGQLIDTINGFSAVRFGVLSLVTVLFLFVEFKMQLNDFNSWIIKRNRATRIMVYYLLLVIILVIGNFSVKPSFIYFQF